MQACITCIKTVSFQTYSGCQELGQDSVCRHKQQYTPIQLGATESRGMLKQPKKSSTLSRLWLAVHSKWDISPSEGHFGVKTIMAAILKGRSKPKRSKLAISKGPSEWRISTGTTDGHFGPPWSFALILSMMTAPPCGHRRIMQKGTSRNSCLVPYTLQPFEALTPEGKPFEGTRA